MNKVLLFLSLLFTIGCFTDNSPSNKPHKTVNNKGCNTINPPFEIALQMNQLADHQFHLVAVLELDSGSYIISPYSKDETYLHFDIFLSDTTHLMVTDTLLEIPSSVEEFDSILNSPVRLVRETTTYEQKIKVITVNDFEVDGLIEFLVEPSCVPYHVQFTLTHHAGKLTVQKTNTTFPSYYIKKEL